jgi:prepilin-type N-terminal cleavage/methylation domain-containing protein
VLDTKGDNMKEKGFTILELLIVLVVVAVLVFLAFVVFSPNKCEQFRNAPVTDTPKECLDYLIGE